jgi:hypothetical protein
MRHPFDGIEKTGRRSFLAGLLGLTAGLFASAAAPPPRPQLLTERLGEDGGPQPSTTAAFEEGGNRRPRVGKDNRSTEALHEEGGGRVITTAAMNEEG